MRSIPLSEIVGTMNSVFLLNLWSGKLSQQFVRQEYLTATISNMEELYVVACENHESRDMQMIVNQCIKIPTRYNYLSYTLTWAVAHLCNLSFSCFLLGIHNDVECRGMLQQKNFHRLFCFCWGCVTRAWVGFQCWWCVCETRQRQCRRGKFLRFLSTFHRENLVVPLPYGGRRTATHNRL